MFVPMLNIVSLLVGLVALVVALVGLVPLFGWLNWLALPIAVVGAGIGVVSSGNSGRNFNLVILVIAIVRLSVGGGIF